MSLQVTAELLSDWSRRGGDSPPGASGCSSPGSSGCSSPETCRRDAAGFPPKAPRPTKPKMSTKRRMKASEREKLRMRSLAEALHQLRDYLPPDYSKRGQPLTKIQTLKSTIDYINKLSDALSRA